VASAVEAAPPLSPVRNLDPPTPALRFPVIARTQASAVRPALRPRRHPRSRHRFRP
jgi:hypothetical protein